MSTKKTKTAEKAAPPVARVRVGLINGSIWERQTEKGVFHTVSLERRYRDAEGNWKSSQSFDADDLLALAKLADLAHTRILELRNAEAE